MKGFTLVVLLLGTSTHTDHARMGLKPAIYNDIVITSHRNTNCSHNELYPAGLVETMARKLVNSGGCTEPKLEAHYDKKSSLHVYRY